MNIVPAFPAVLYCAENQTFFLSPTSLYLISFMVLTIYALQTVELEFDFHFPPNRMA